MNSYTLIIAFTLVFTYILKIISNSMNLRAASSALPEEFEGTYDPKAYAKSQEYLVSQTKFGLFHETFDLLVILGFWFSGGFNWLDGFASGYGYGVVVTGLIFIGILILAQGILSLPFELYSTFVIEEKFGFNKTTLATFFSDHLKGVTLGIILGAPLVAGIIWFFEYAGPLAWLWCWIGITLFTLILQYVAPTWIMPLFNKFVPLEDGPLKSAIMDYAKAVNFPLTGIYVIDGSKRSTKSNAFFTGFGKNKRIALYDTLVNNHSTDELVAILAHEIGHYKKKHIQKGMIISIVHTGILFYLLSLFLKAQGLFDAFFMDQISVYAGLIFFGLLYTPIEFILSIGMQIFSRKNEYEADHFVSQTFNNPLALVDALKKLSVNNLSNLTPHPFYVFLNYSHPPVLRRIEALRKAVVETQTNHQTELV